MQIKLSSLGLTLAILLGGCEVQSTHSPTPSKLQQVELDQLANTLQIKKQVLENRYKDCNNQAATAHDAGQCMLMRIEVTPKIDLANSDWAIYFSLVDPLKVITQSEGLNVEHINGDLHKILPSQDFNGFEAGKSLSVEFIARGHYLTDAEFMPNFYIASEGLQAKDIVSTKAGIDPETGLETRPYAVPLGFADQVFYRSANDKTPKATSSYLYDKYADVTKNTAHVDTGIIPTPSKVVQNRSAQRFDLSQGLTFNLTGIKRDAIDAAINRLAVLGATESANGSAVNIQIDTLLTEPESYQLVVSAQSIDIKAADKAGAFYALSSVASLITIGQTSIAQINIEDSPRFGFRGVHVDVARNFHSKAFILKLMTQMSAYKMNKLHLHLGDDEGWRLEIKGLPELTEVGAKRCHDPEETTCLLAQLGAGSTGEGEVNGYYSISDYQEILRAATANHIQVIPSFDMPGHSRAAIKSMEARYKNRMAQGDEAGAKQYLLTDFEDQTQYESIQFYTDNTLNVCMESTYDFIEKIMVEMKQVHLAAGQPLTRYHIGADETAGAWKDSPICRNFMQNNTLGINTVEQLGGYFIERVSNLLADLDIEVAGWNDGMGHTNPANMPKVVQSNAWGVLPWGGHAAAHKQVNQNWQVVVSTPDALYFDFPYEPDPMEAGYTWASRHISTRRVFEFQPENLPIHAEFWQGPEENNYQIDDREQRDDAGNVTHSPIKKGLRFAGMQGHIWSETIRSDSQTEYQLFPRLLAVAERAWHQAEWEVPYNHQGALFNQSSGVFTAELRKQRDNEFVHFANLLGQKELNKLDLANVAYRVPTVGAKVIAGKLHANLIYPGLTIEYKTDNGNWQQYQQPIAVEGDIQVRAVAADGQRKGRTIQVQ